ncbi:MAG: sensor histidine kinase [Agriterribacter sp.]
MACRRLFILLLLIGLTVNGLCQELSEKNFDWYNKTAGLSHDNITGIVQDSTGYIWAGTSYGINRFDGSRFAQFHTTSDEQSPASEEITGMAALDKDRVAFYSNGLHIINTKTGKSHNVFIPWHDPQYMFKFNMIMKVISDADGSIFILTRSGVYSYDSSYTLKKRFDYYKEDAVASSHFYFGQDMLELNNDLLLINAEGGLYVFEKRTGNARKMQAADCPALAEFLDYPNTNYTFVQPAPGRFIVFTPESKRLVYVDAITGKKVISSLPFINNDDFGWRTKLFKQSDTSFYVTSQSAGLYRFHFNPATGSIRFYAQKYFQKFLCNGMLADREGNLWIATNMGLFRENAHRNAVEIAGIPAHVSEKYPALKIDHVCTVGRKVYAATRGAGMFIFDEKRFSFSKQKLFTAYAPRANVVRGIVPLNDSKLLLAADGYPLEFNTGTETTRLLNLPSWDKAHYWMAAITRDQSAAVWMSSSLMYRYHIASGKADTIAYRHLLPESPGVVHAGIDGNVWIGGHGIARFNTGTQQFDLTIDSFPFLKMPDKQVNDIVTDRQHRVWFNSRNNGVIAYNTDHKTFIHLTQKDGLPDNNITSMIIVGDELWTASYLGLSCINLHTLKITRFGKEDGFPDLPVSKDQNFFYDSVMQLLYIGFSDKLVRFNPFTLLRQQMPPKTFIETVALGNDSVYFLPGETIYGSWANNNISITIGCIHFSNAANHSFAYRILKNETTPWQVIGGQPSFTISSLPPGINRIQVKSYAADGRWTDQVVELVVEIAPPFWMQTWFLLLSFVFFTGAIYLFVKWRIGNVRRKEMEKTRIEKLKADDYKNQFELEQISNYFSASLSGKKTEDEILWDVTEKLMSRMHYEDCVIYLWNSDKTKMVQKAAYGPKGRPEIISAGHFEVLPGQGIVGKVMESKRPILVNDTRKDDRYRVDDAFRLSEAAVPIIHNNELLGVVDSESSSAGYYTERDIKILTTIATLIGNKLAQLATDNSLAIKQKELARINIELAEAKLAALQAQMNPHFVFNALNSIKRLILEQENEKASRYLSKFASMIRMTLDHSRESFVSLHENIEYLHAYIEMEKLRFDNTLSYHLSVEEGIDVHEFFFPTLIIQPVIENAIWHGLLPSKKEKILQVFFTRIEDKIRCTVCDNGIGIEQSERNKTAYDNTHRSWGLENLRNRIRIFNEKYDVQGTLEIIDMASRGTGDHGTCVILTFRNAPWQ